MNNLYDLGKEKGLSDVTSIVVEKIGFLRDFKVYVTRNRGLAI